MVRAIPLEFLPYGRDFSIVLKVSKGVVPVTGHRDLFARQPAAILQPAFADDRLQAGHSQISAQGEVVLAGTYENDIPFLVNHLNSTPTAMIWRKIEISYWRKILRYFAILSANPFWSSSSISTISILSASGNGG